MRLRLRGPAARGPDLEGGVGESGLCRIKPYFATTPSGEIDRARVNSLEIAVDFTDARDVTAVVEFCCGLAVALGAPLVGDDSRRLDSEALLEILWSRVRTRDRARWRARFTALAGLVIVLAGGLCIYGFEETGPGGLARRHNFVGVGASLIVLGLASMAFAAMDAIRD